jgi:hypothetical protein
MINISSAIIIFLIIYWIYCKQFYRKNLDTQFITDVIDWKTGDIIFFKGFNYLALVHQQYFTHVGLVYMIKGVPYIFEANGLEHTHLKPEHNKYGIFLTPLLERCRKYKGIIYLKKLNREITKEMLTRFEEFINYAINNMYYNYAIITSFFRKLLGLEKCHRGTNCAEIIFLSLIKMGLINYSEYEKKYAHFLEYVSEIKEMNYGYKYEKEIELIDHPFAD